ncbi:hypothetical protein Angca_002247, partial [Angiostrongylus cantonensis]
GTDGSPGESFSLVLQGGRRSRATLEIQVVDVNDNPPQFISPPTVLSVNETSPGGFAIATLRTRDVDTGISGMARFSVDVGIYILLFHNGNVFSQRAHHVLVTAEDGNPHSNRTNSVIHALTIHVIDEDDEPPIFVTDLSKPIQLSASQAVGDVIVTLRAVDGDEVMTNKTKIRYSIEENEYLEIEPTSGSVKLKKMPGPHIELRVKVTATEESGRGMESVDVLRVRGPPEQKTEDQMKFAELCESPAYSARIKEGASDFEEPLIVRLTSPVNPSALRIEGAGAAFVVDPSSTSVDVRIVPSNASLVDYEKQKTMELFAIDADSALYSPITYSIHGVGSELFAISPQGKLRSLVPMDREKHEQFDLVVRATDAGGLWTNCPGRIVVRDVNDNTPRFEHSEYLLEIDEEKSLKRQFEAIDLDIGENGHIVYSLENVPDGTAIDVSGGMLFIGKLDRDTMAEQDIRLVLRATDRGQAPRSSTINITVRVRDINDHWPAFTNSRYSFVLDANISPGGVIGSVKASDADATTPNNAVKYVSEDPRFQISDDGDVIYDGDGILSKASLRENFDTSAEFRVFALDGGEPTRNGSSTVVINEHKSSMQNVHTVELKLTETEQRSAIEWANSGKRGYTYEITRATSDGFADEGVLQWIEMDKNTGVFRTRQPLPERVKQIRLYLSMKKGKREVPVELIINVVNSSNSVPLFKKSSYKAVVAEDVGIGSRLLQVKADGENPIKYSLEISTGPTNLLDIDDDGFIRNLAKLDFEAFRYIEGRILARNQEGNTASTNFSIILSDVNDNRPVFVNGSVLSTSIDESADVGFVLELSYPLARDGDEGEFSRLLYSLVGSEDHFDIDRRVFRTSTITLASKLDYESQRSHSLTVRCVDNAGEEPFNEVFASVIVLVRDVNDNPPVIHNSDLDHLTVYEDTPVGTSISTVSASDLDEGGKQSVILDANHTLFSVTDGGKLVVAEKLDGHAGERICSHIQATDSGSPPLSVSYPYCVTNVRYDELLRIKLLEEDDMGLVTYKFEQTFKKDWEAFSLNASGSLISNSPFDFERKPVHELRILACHYLNCSSVHVFISVNDRNDNCPLFPRQVFHLSLVENDRSPPPRQIGHVPVALDADFHTDNTKVIAYDCQLACIDPHQSQNATITGVLTVNDVNDNFPRFSEKAYYFTVIQGQASPGSHLGRVSATDFDVETNGLNYSISGAIRAPKQSFPLSNAPISIEAGTGRLTVNEPLREPSYSFTVVVTDGVGHVDSAAVVISVITYSQQTELLFDAPFDFINKNEKNVVKRLMSSNSTARRELRNAYGLREIDPVSTSGSNSLEAVILGVLLIIFVLLLTYLSLHCRQRQSYTRKLRHISSQAAHHASLSHEPAQKINLYYTTEKAPTRTRSIGPPQPPLPPPLQSTEL